MNIVSVILTLICLALLAWLRSPLAIIILRGLAGVLSAVTLISASLWLLQHMKHHNGAPILFAGVGMGIFMSAEFIAAGKALAFSSQQIWLLCAITATMLFLCALRGLLSPADSLLALNSGPATTMPSDNGRMSDAVKLLLIYGLAGFGYIITATYLPLFLHGALSGIDPVHLWAVFGLAAVPSCFIWHQLVLKIGYQRAFCSNLVIQAFGVALPAWSHSFTFCLLSALLVGATFLGTVTIALSEGKRLNQAVKFNMIAALTATYGVGQIIGPLVADGLYSLTGSFNPSLLTASGVLLGAAGLVACGRRQQ